MADERHGSDPVSEEAIEWFARLRDSGVTDEDHAAFARWRDADPDHARAYAEVETLWIGFDELPAPARASEAYDEPAHRRWSRWRVGGVPLLALALVAVSWTQLPPGGVAVLLADERTGVAEVRRLTLPDGSEAILDAGSALSYDITARERRVTLVSGTAFFRVAHERSRPFVVEAGKGEIRDIGTAFEVVRESGGARVAVSEGVVELAIDGGGAAVLKAGQSLAWRGKLETVRPVAPGDVGAWRRGRLVFVDTPLGAVLADLERHGARRTWVADRQLLGRRLTGAFDLSAPDAALQAVLERAGARLDRIGPVAIVRAR